MLRVYGCIVHAHDLRFVFVAAVLCVFASLAAIHLLHHAKRSSRPTNNIWVAVAAVTTSFGVWATHFVAMLAFQTGLQTGYEGALTVLSLAVAMAWTGIGFVVAQRRQSAIWLWVGGGIVGAGISAMHYIGMAAFEVEGHLAWDLGLVLVSVTIGVAVGSVALGIGLRSKKRSDRILGALALTVAICGMHFVGMGAVEITPDPSVEVSASAIPSQTLSIAVAAAGFAILILTGIWLGLDIREVRRKGLESSRMLGLANAAVEGLLICCGDRIVTSNNSFAKLSGHSMDALTRSSLAAILPDDEARRTLMESESATVETNLLQGNGQTVPVELIRQTIDYGGRPHHVIAIRDLRDRKQAEQHIQFLAHHDALTGLMNRAAFNVRFDQEIVSARKTGQPLGIFCLDLDRFKEVNDIFGHAVGDDLLRAVARRITEVLAPNQVAARLGGDEFAILAPGLADGATAGDVADMILEAFRTTKASSVPHAPIATSIGIALFPDDATDRQTLLNHADTALYRAKAEGRGTYRFFEARMGLQVRERRRLEYDLRQAIERAEFRLVYQPQTVLDDGRLVGFEALLRWGHRERGEIPPSLFIPIAEESGSILQIGAWVLRKACAEAASWSRPLRIAVNVSTVQAHDPAFAQLVRDVLFETGLPPARLELEITETALIRNLDRTLVTLRQLKSIGVRIAMDDFGTGYSSLSNLRTFPFDKIKIDASFVRSVDRNEQAAAIVQAVLGLGRGLGLPVLAEGVETRAELAFLEQAQCDEAQGYLLGRPAAIETFAHLLGPAPANRPHEDHGERLQRLKTG